MTSDSLNKKSPDLSSTQPLCAHQQICRGCTHLDRTPSQEAQDKKGALRSGLQNLFAERESPQTLNDLKYLRGPEFGFRHRVDLQIHGGDQGFQAQKIGFFIRDSKEIFGLQSCPLLVEDLNLLLGEIQKLHFPIKKGSMRLRSFQGKRGLWLDFSNQDIHHLLTDARSRSHSLLAELQKLGIVEIGQRRKRLTADFKLIDPVLETWSETFLTEDKTQFLLNPIAGFTQPGSETNRLLIREFRGILELMKCATKRSAPEQNQTAQKQKQWVEFGAGNGNLSLPFLCNFPGRKLLALEYDESSFEGLKRAASDFTKNIMFRSGDFQKLSLREGIKAIPYSQAEGLIVNPPRAGVGAFFAPLLALEPVSRPEFVIYISCYLDSFIRDCKNLLLADYQLREIKIIDQFPHTEHFEIIALWQQPDSTHETRPKAID